MFICTNCSFTRKKISLAVRLVCAVLLLLMATNRQSSANALNPPDEDCANDIKMDSPKKTTLISSAVFANTTSSHFKSCSATLSNAADGEMSSHSAIGTGRAPDWNGLFRDTGVLFGGQAAAAALTYVLPQSFSGWTEDQKKDGLKKYSRNFVDPVLDKDKFYVNYMLHPYWGATYYTRARERDLDKTSSFLYSALMSAMYEFGTECFAERPSMQDLIVTPVGGSLLGAFVFEPIRNSIKSKPELRWYDHALLVATDPLGLLSLGVEKMLGIKSTIKVDYAPSIRNNSAGSTVASNGSRVGFVMQFPLN